MLVLQIEALECNQKRGERRFFKIFWVRTPTPLALSGLRGVGHNLSPLKLFDLATGPFDKCHIYILTEFYSINFQIFLVNIFLAENSGELHVAFGIKILWDFVFPELGRASFLI